MIGISRKYADRIAADAEETLRGLKFPPNQARQLRQYILDRAEVLASQDAETTRKEWAKKREESKARAVQAAKETAKWHEHISENASQLWGEANLGFLAEILRFADEEHGEELARYVIHGAPTHAVFPTTNLFEKFSPEELKKHADKQEVERAKFRVKERAKLPEWVSKKEMEKAFLAFLSKARNPVEVFCAFADLIDPVF